MQLPGYWASVSFVVIAIVVILRFVVRRDYRLKGRLTPVSSVMEWLLAIIWAAFSYAYLPADWPSVRVIPVLQWAGWVCIGIGVPVMIGSMAWLGLRRSHGLESEVLIQTGPYRLSRNPQIAGFWLGMAGFFMLWPSWHMLVSTCLLLLFTHLMVITEEEHLLARHGDLYRSYCSQVPRYFDVRALIPGAGIDALIDGSRSDRAARGGS